EWIRPRPALSTRRWRGELVDGAARGHSWIKLDFTERAFVAHHVLLQYRQQRLGLLRAEIDALKVMHFYLGLTLLLQSSEHQKKIPHIHSYLHAISVRLAVLRAVHQLCVGLHWFVHSAKSLTA